MKLRQLFFFLIASCLLLPAASQAAYHHQGERDADKFLAAYPDLTGTKLDNCALCHRGGEIEKNFGTMKLGSCQWCHDTYGYDGAGDITQTMNTYGTAYKTAGRNAAAVSAIDSQDSDGDGFINSEEIAAKTYPGDATDYPGLTPAPARVYTKAQIEAMETHTEFLMMNTSRSGDFYAEYTGVPMKTLLDDAGILESATGIEVYALDAWSQTHPLTYTEGDEMYHVYGDMPNGTDQYPPGTFNYDAEADEASGGWCDYSAPSCEGRTHGDPIFVDGGLKAILAYAREGADLEPGVLNDENRLDGEGPFRVIVPQKAPSPPDQSSKSDDQDVIWPYEESWDHNAGACTKSVTFIKVEPLPEGTTDVDVYEAGWQFVDENKIVIYGAIDDSDANGNGVFDSEEQAGNPANDMDEDGTPDYQDTDCARFRHVNGNAYMGIHCSSGQLAAVKNYQDSDAIVPQTGKPAHGRFPYGVFDYKVTGLTEGETVTVTYLLPESLPENAVFYKISSENGWQPLDFEKIAADRIRVTLTDGDPATDADGAANGTIVDPSAIGVAADGNSGGDSDSSCFIDTLFFE